VCTDKTRTLTSGEMTIVRVWAAGREFDLLADPVEADAQLTAVLRTAALASRQQASAGSEVSAPDKGGSAGPLVDPVDAAVLHAIGRIGLDLAHLDDGSSVVGVVPFSSERKLMASFHERDGRLTAFVKGAPRRVLEKLRSDLPQERRAALVAVNDGFAGRGLRVLAVATGEVGAPSEAALRDLTCRSAASWNSHRPSSCCSRIVRHPF
jgi:Ca2+-transporting ATPase